MSEGGAGSRFIGANFALPDGASESDRNSGPAADKDNDGPVRVALADYGISAHGFGTRVFHRMLLYARGPERRVLLAIRNSFPACVPSDADDDGLFS
jgi:hypothetical protein